MKSTPSRLIPALVISLLTIAATLTPMQTANAATDHSDGFVTAAFGGVNLSKTESFDARFTPMAVDGFVSGAADRWSHFHHWDINWDSGDAQNPVWAFIRFGSYRKVGETVFGNLDFHVRGAIEVRANQGTTCDANAWNNNEIRTINGVQTRSSICWRGTSMNVGRDYMFSLVPDRQLGDNWWMARLVDRNNAANTTTVGSIKVASATPDLNIKSSSWSLTYMGDAKPCNAVPSMDTLIWQPTSSSGVQTTFVSRNVGRCINGSFDWVPSRGSWYALVGGAQKSQAPTDTTVSTDKRQPRSSASWSRPSGLLPGLSQVAVSGYFADNPRFFATATEILRARTTSATLPQWDVSYEFPTFTSAWWGGYFIPDATGTWDFQLTSDDASYLWLGKSAVNDYFYNGTKNALIALPGVHPKASSTASLYLEKDRIYPIRIQYGNDIDASSFRFEVKPPSYKGVWDTNLEGLIWSSDYTNTEDCTNFGISYTLSQSLGYGVFDIPDCKNNPAKLLTGNTGGAKDTSNNNEKPSRPTFTGVNFSGNKLNINVDIGSGPNLPDNIYLVAPNLGISSGNAILGKITGRIATWTIQLGDLLSGASIPLEIFSERAGIRSDVLTGNYRAPLIAASNRTLAVPAAPSNFKSRIAGSSALVTVDVKYKEGAIPTKVHLFGNSLGINKRNAIVGDIVATKALVEVPIRASMAGKKFPVSVYLSNGKGESKPLTGTVTIPRLPKAPSLANMIPLPSTKAPKSILCFRGNQNRTFLADSCPPGWERR